MAYSEELATRIRARFNALSPVEEKPMMGGLTFMYHDKMCVGIIGDELMCRIHPDLYESSLQKPGCRPMDFTGKLLRGYVLISDAGMRSQEDFDYWIDLALDFNPEAKSSKKKKPLYRMRR